MKAFGDFLHRLKVTADGNATLFDRTMVLSGSHMYGGGHNNRNLPIPLVGGGFRHGRHLAFGSDNDSPLANHPFANLFVTVLPWPRLEVDCFASSTGTTSGLESSG